MKKILFTALAGLTCLFMYCNSEKTVSPKEALEQTSLWSRRLLAYVEELMPIQASDVLASVMMAAGRFVGKYGAATSDHYWSVFSSSQSKALFKFGFDEERKSRKN